MWFKSWYAHPVEITEINPAGTHFQWIKFKSLWVEEIAILPGQYLNTDLFDGQDYHRRSYTPIRCQNGDFGFLIENLGGKLSSELLRKPAKSVIRISGASGKEKLFPPETNQHVIFVCFGSGISFALSLVSLVSNLQKFPVLFMGLKSDADSILGVMEKEGLSLNLEVVTDWNHLFNRIRQHSTDPNDLGFYLSGDGQKIKFTERFLLSDGIKPVQIFKEIYYNHKADPDPEWSFDQGSLPGKESW